jgi:hypothetical protein
MGKLLHLPILRDLSWKRILLVWIYIMIAKVLGFFFKIIFYFIMFVLFIDTFIALIMWINNTEYTWFITKIFHGIVTLIFG